MTQRRHGGFGQKLYVYVADHQLAAKCAADAAMEISFQDARSLRGRSRRPPLYARSPVVMLRVALPSPRIRRDQVADLARGRDGLSTAQPSTDGRRTSSR